MLQLLVLDRIQSYNRGFEISKIVQSQPYIKPKLEFGPIYNKQWAYERYEHVITAKERTKQKHIFFRKKQKT